jgi:predicted nucleotidyltransferase
MRTTADILAALGQFKAYATKRYGIDQIGVFGSVARGEQTDNSDVDIFYSGKALSLFTLDEMQCELEKLLGCKVDIVRMRDNMNPLLRSRIKKEGCYV